MVVMVVVMLFIGVGMVVFVFEWYVILVVIYKLFGVVVLVLVCVWIVVWMLLRLLVLFDDLLWW